MASNVYELNINISNLSSDTSASSVMNKTNTGSLPSDKKNSDGNALSSKSITAGAIGAAAYSSAKRTVTSVATYELNKTGSLYGDVAKQNSINNSMSAANNLAQIGGIVAATAINPVLGAFTALNYATSSIFSMYSNHAEYVQTQIDNERDSDKETGRLGKIANSKGRTFNYE